MSTATVLDEVAAERARQDEKWGGAGHDDGHHARDWLWFIVRHGCKVFGLDIGVSPSSQGFGSAVGRRHLRTALTAYCRTTSPERFRKAMIRVAALAVAAVEWNDRTDESRFPKMFDDEGGE